MNEDNERLRAALARVDELMIRERQSNKGYVREVRRIVRAALSGEPSSVPEPKPDCGAYHPWSQARCQLPKGHEGPHGHYHPAQVFNPWPPLKSSGEFLPCDKCGHGVQAHVANGGHCPERTSGE